MADVFLSYTSSDREAAERVQQALSARGIDVFWDQEVPPGQDWDAWIRSKLSACRVAVVLWSHASVKSPNVKHEAIVARDAGKLVPAMIDILTPEDFPMGLYLVQAVNLHDWRSPGSKGMARLVAEIEARVKKSPAPQSRVAPTPPPFGGGAGSGSLPMLLAMGVLAIGIAAGAWWMLTQPKDKDGAAGGAQVIATSSSSNAEAGKFSQRMLGHWRWSDSQPCAAGPNITMEGGRLIVTTPEVRYVHMIDLDAALETRTTVLRPAEVNTEKYVFTPEFFATSETRSFNLIVDETTKSERNVWTPCEL